MIKKVDIKIVEKYLSAITADKFHRYKSWDHCFQSFTINQTTDNQALQLAFYLASWGMYRGSSGLLQKNHLIHSAAVEILTKQKYQHLKCDINNEIKKNNINDIICLKKELSNYYISMSFSRGMNVSKSITPTDTLISKILLGSFGCVPAYDRYFKKGLSALNMEFNKFNKDSLNELFNFIEANDSEINACQKLIKNKIDKHYPVMKILDIYFWQVGFDN